MTIPVSCPGCGNRLNLSESLAGKTIKCFQCNADFQVPAVEPADEYEVVDRALPTRRVAARPVDDDRPRKKSARAVEEDEDDRPRRKSSQKKGVPVWVFAAAGGGLLVVVGVVALLLFGGLGRKVPGAGGLVSRSAPPGFSEVRDSEGGFRVFMPGHVSKAEHRNDGRPLPPGAAYSAFGGTDGNVHSFTRAIRPGNDFNPGTSPEQLYGLLKLHGGGIEAPWNEVVSRTPITLGGKPALELKVREKKDWMGNTVPVPEADDDPRLPAEIRQHRREVADSLKKSREAQRGKPGKREVYYVTTDGKRAIILHLETMGDFPSDVMLKTIRESFEFL